MAQAPNQPAYVDLSRPHADRDGGAASRGRSTRSPRFMASAMPKLQKYGAAFLAVDPKEPMPELPEVETVRRGLAPAFVGARIARGRGAPRRLALSLSRAVRRAADRAAGRERCRGGPNICSADLDTGETLVMHLGMSGSFRIEHATGRRRATFHFARSKTPAHDHVVLRVRSGARVVYNDPRRFGFMDLAATAALDEHPLFRRPRRRAARPQISTPRRSPRLLARLARAAEGARCSTRRRIAGLGNIYVCEALHRARPLADARGGRRLTRAEADAGSAAGAAIRAVLEEAVAAGGSTLRDHRQTDGDARLFPALLRRLRPRRRRLRPRALPRDHIRTVQSGRSTFYCPKCQI